jgi:hypothetical protein
MINYQFKDIIIQCKTFLFKNFSFNGFLTIQDFLLLEVIFKKEHLIVL